MYSWGYLPEVLMAGSVLTIFMFIFGARCAGRTVFYYSGFVA